MKLGFYLPREVDELPDAVYVFPAVDVIIDASKTLSNHPPEHDVIPLFDIRIWINDKPVGAEFGPYALSRSAVGLSGVWHDGILPTAREKAAGRATHLRPATGVPLADIRRSEIILEAGCMAQGAIKRPRRQATRHGLERTALELIKRQTSILYTRRLVSQKKRAARGISIWRPPENGRLRGRRRQCIAQVS